MYDNSAEFIYKMIARRISVYKRRYKLRNRDLIPWDPSLASAIAHNRRNPKKNPYLIPSNTARSFVPLNYITRFASAFKISEADLIWGTWREQNLYKGAFFFQIVKDAINDSEVKNSVKKALYEYIPYAIEDFFKDCSEDYKVMGMYPDDLITDNSKTKAIARLYSRLLDINLSNTFIQTDHRNYFEVDINVFFREIMNQPSTYKLNQRIENTVHTYLVPLMIDQMYPLPYDPEGNFLKDNDQLVNIEQDHFYYGPERLDHLSGTFYDLDKRIGAFVEADVAKIRSLYSAQLESEGEPNVRLLENEWCPTVCLL